ncbi:MAG: hypothetical protein Q8O54_12295 [Brevundimonas sp.]|nr:hypothetical protein [Brevundimonas sp.]
MTGVEETHAEFESATADRWAISRARLAEYRRTGETISVEEFMAELDREIEKIRVQKA